MVHRSEHSWKRKLLPYLKNPHVLGVILIALVIPVTYYMIGQQTRVRQEAATLPNQSSTIRGVADYHADSFESGDMSKWTSNMIESGNTLEVIPQAANNGTYGLHVKTATTDQSQLIKNIPDATEIYTRVKMKVVQKTPQQFMQSLFQLTTNTGSAIFSFGIRQQSATDGVNFNVTVPGSDSNIDTNYDLPLNTWQCIETHVVQANNKATITVWANGTQIYTATKDVSEMTIQQIRVGTKGQEGVSEYYYDDVAADNINRIGCDQLVPDPGPVRTNLVPQGILQQDTTQITMSLTTDVPAMCKYSSTQDPSFDAFTNAFSTTGTTTHSVILSNLVPRTQYTYYIKCKDSTGKVNTTDEKVQFSIPIDRTVAKPLSLAATYHSISIYAGFDGDDNANNTASFQYRKVGTTKWIQGMEMSPDRRAFARGNGQLIDNAFKFQWRASALMVDPGTPYEVKVTFTDPDGVAGSTTTTTITTRSENYPSNGATYYVSPSGNDTSGTGTKANPWKTIQKAISVVTAGDTILVSPGTYQGRVLITKSGTQNAFITIRPEIPLTIQQMKNPSFASQKVVLDGSTIPRNADMCGEGNSSDGTCVVILGGSYIRFGGFEIVKGQHGIKVAVATIPATDGVNNVIVENNYIHAQDFNPGGSGIFVGDTFSAQNQTQYITIQNNEIVSNFKDPNGNASIQFNAQAGGNVVRNNRMIFTSKGTGAHGLDCMAGLPNFGQQGGYYKDTDIYNNYCDGATDEGIEIDGGNANIRVWGNILKRTNLGFSITPVYYGPVYIFRNVMYDPQQAWVNSCIGIKSGEGGQGFVYIYHNTFYLGDLGKSTGAIPRCAGIKVTAKGSGYTSAPTVEITGGGGTGAQALAILNGSQVESIFVLDGGSGYTSTPTINLVGGGGTGATAVADLNGGSATTYAPNGSPPDAVNVFMRNNILHGFDRVLSLFRTDSKPNLDYNMMAEEYSADNVYLKYADAFYSTFEAFRSSTGQEAHGINAKAEFVNVSTGDLRLKDTSPGVNAGVSLPGFNDTESAWPAVGSAPDIGAYESGSTVATPTPTTVPSPIVSVTPVSDTTIPSTQLSLSPATASKTTGTTTTSNVLINTNNSVTNADLAFTFNPAAIEVTNVALGSFLSNAQEVEKTINNTTGKVLYSFYTDGANAKSGTGTLATITWRAKSAGTSTLSFDPSTTIVYGTGTGNTIASGGLSSATYTVTGTTVPTATPTAGPLPTATNTPVPPTSTPASASCTIGTASWNLSSVDEGTLVTLRANVTGTGCTGKQVTFKVRENDSILEGGLDEDATTQPAAAVVSGSTATTTWLAEWQNDCNGLCNSPEYYFNATLAGGNTVRSADPLLSVQKTETAVTLKLTLPYLSASQDMLNSTVTIRNTQTNTDVSKTVTLVPGTNNTYTGTLQTVLTPGEYAMVVKRHQFLAKRFTFTVGSTAPNLDFSSTPLVGGDINNDNVINTLDLGKVIEEYSPQADTTAVSDLTRDKRINALDLGVVIENYFKQGESL